MNVTLSLIQNYLILRHHLYNQLYTQKYIQIVLSYVNKHEPTCLA